MNRDTRRALAIALLMLVTGTLQAALVRGEDVPLNVDLNGQPTDPKIAEIQKIVHVKYEPFSSNFESVPQRPLDLDVQCISRVFRNEQTGFLTFTYGFDVVSPGTSDGFSEGSSGSVESYKGFGVNGLVSADELRKEVMLDSEGPNSTPGPVVVFSDLLRGTQHPPAFVLATNATRFDQNGIAKAHGEDEELLRNIETGQDQLDLIKGDTTVTGVFEPSAAIPLPAGVYPVSAMLAGGLIIRMLRMKKANVSQ